MRGVPKDDHKAGARVEKAWGWFLKKAFFHAIGLVFFVTL